MQTQSGPGRSLDTTVDNQDIGTWQNPERIWSSSERIWSSSVSSAKDEIIVDTHDKEAWPSIGDQCETTVEAVHSDDTVKSKSVIYSSSNLGQDPLNISSAIHGASSVWSGANFGGSNIHKERLDSDNSWSSSPISASQIDSSHWSDFHQVNSVNNQGHMQSSQSSNSGSDNSNPLSNNPVPGLNWGISNTAVENSNGQTSTMQGLEHGTISSGAHSANNGPTLTDSQSATSNAMSWQGINFSSSAFPGLQKDQAANQSSTWGNSSVSNSVIGPGLPLPTTAGSYSMDNNSEKGIDQWGATSTASTSLGWNSQSVTSQPEPSGWGSPCPSPNPGAGTEAWGSSDIKNPPQAWGQPNSTANRPPSSWGQADAKTTSQSPSGWGDTPQDTSTSSSGWGQPPKSTPSPWGQQPPPTNQTHWGGAASNSPSQITQSQQWGSGAAGTTTSSASSSGPQSAWGSSGPVGSKPPPPPPTQTQQPPPPPQQQQQQPPQQQPPQQPTSWAQAAGRGLYAQQQLSKPPTPTATTPTLDPKEQMIAQAVNNHDGWGKRPVRQDTHWDMEESPKLRRRNSNTEIENPSSHWDNNKGTAIWEASKGSAGPPPPAPSWGGNANPRGDPRGDPRGASGGGGDWGSDNDSGHWNGPPDSGNSSQWSGPPSNHGNNQWGGNSGANHWGDSHRDGSGDRNSGRDTHWGGSSSSNSWDSGKSDNTWGGNGGSHGPPSGGPGGPPPVGGKEDNVWDRNGTNAWGNNSKVETGMWGGQRRGSSSSWGDDNIEPQGWDDGSHQSGHQRQNSGSSVDDGTSYWGDPTSAPPPKVPPNWNSQPPTPSTPGPMRGPPDDKSIGMWGVPPKQPQMSWDQKGDDGTGFWTGGQPPQNWNDNQWPGAKPKGPSGAWGDAGADWNQPGRRGTAFIPGGNGRQPPQMRSKLLQQLTEMGFKREDAQNALISNNMNMERAIADLVQGAKTRQEFDMDGKKDGRKIQGIQPDGLLDTHSDISQFVPPLPNTPFNAQPTINSQVIANSLKPGVPSLQNTSSLVGVGQSSISPSIQQRIIQQQMSQPHGHPPVHSQMSTQSMQHKILQQTVQQLRMAVQAGLISPSMLNQQLTPNTRVMLHQLLQFQETHKQLVTQQQLLQQHLMQQKNSNPHVAHQLESQLEQVTLTLQHIKQQMARLKQQMAQIHSTSPKQADAAAATAPKADLLKDLTANMNTMNLQKESQVYLQQQQSSSQQGSRLNQWKLPSPEKDGVDLNKAPGSKPLTAAHSAPNLQNKMETSVPSTIFPDSTWSTGINSSGSGSWPSSGAISSTASTSSQDGTLKESPSDSDVSLATAAGEIGVSVSVSSSTPSSASPGALNPPGININDMIEEFVPGKRWQGIAKSVEDDPYITPGSAQRPALSVNTIKDDYVMTTLSGKSNSPTVSESSMGSTWGSGSFGGLGKSAVVGGPATRSSWSSSSSLTEGPGSIGSDLWGIPQNSKNTRPPPGLTNQKPPSNWQTGAGGFNRSVSWAPGDRSFSTTMGNSWTGGQQGASNCLLLKNLTPQIDGSTLRTLCQQHGPLQAFYLNLGYGQAIVRYGAKEEAVKAQKSLNSCVLGNTTIVAEFVSDNDAHRLLEQLNAQGVSSSSSQPLSGLMRSTSEAVSSSSASAVGSKEASQWNGASSVWSTAGIGSGGGVVGSSSLWDGTTPGLDEHHSLLPGDLLNGSLTSP